MKNKGLGRGLSALISDSMENDKYSKGELITIDIEKIIANSKQPRKIFKQNELEELSNSIKQNGILQPIIVRNTDKGNYEIIAGERRWRAAKIIGLERIPCIIKDLGNQQSFEIALVENIQRENLNPIEEAESYLRLTEDFSYTQEKIATIVNKSRSHIANLLRLNSLSAVIKQHLSDGTISLGHAKLLVGIEDGEEIAQKIINDSLSVRDTELLLKKRKLPAKQTYSKNIAKKEVEYVTDEDTLNLENSLTLSLNMKTKIHHGPNGSNLTIYFDDLNQLDLLIQKLTGTI